MGELEGRSDDAAFALLDEVWLAWARESRLALTAGPGGESGQQLFARAKGAVEEILAAEPGGTILIVAHSGVLQMLIPALCANLASDFGIENWLRNCQLVRVESDGADPAAMSCLTWGDLTVSQPAPKAVPK